MCDLPLETSQWEKKYLGEIAEIIGGGTPSRKHPEYFQGKNIWLTPTEIPKKTITLICDSKEKINDDGLKSSSAKLMPKGTVLMTSRASIGYVAIAGQEVSTNQGFASFVCKENIHNYYLAYWLQSKKDEFIQHATGTTFKEISKSKLRNFVIPVPSLPEQIRIVNKIEALFTQLDAGTAALKRVQAGLKRYKASVLKAAVEGRLVPQDPNDEPAAEMLRRLGKKPLEGEDLPPLPQGWCWTKLGSMTDLTSGHAFKKSEYSTTGARLLQIANVSFGKIIWEQEAFLPIDYLQKYPQLALKPGNILMALNRPILSGELKIGRLNTDDAPAILYQRVGKFDFFMEGIDNFFYYYAQSPIFISNLKKVLQGVDQPFINKPVLLGFPFPLAPQNEMARIVLVIEQQLSIIDELEMVINSQLFRGIRLRQAILRQAFEGKL